MNIQSHKSGLSYTKSVENIVMSCVMFALVWNNITSLENYYDDNG